MGFFNDTSGLGASSDFGSTNNAAADFTRLNDANPAQFQSPIIDRLFGKKAAAARHDLTPAPGEAPAAPGAPPATNPAPAISSGSSLVGRVLKAASGPPSYDASGAALVPGTSLTPQQFAQQLLAANKPAQQPYMGLHNEPYPGQTIPPAMLPGFQGIPQFNGPPPPDRQVPPPPSPASSWFSPRPPQPQPQPQPQPAPGLPPPPVGMMPSQPPSPPPPYLAPMFQNPRPNVNPYARNNDMNLNGLPALTDPLFPLMPSRGFFRGGDVQSFRRGGLPHLMMGLPERMAHGGAQGNGYVPPDGQGDGRSDHVEARLSPGEFVQDAETTSLLGNGDNSAGARGWEAIRQAIREEKGKSLAKGKFSPDAKSPQHYARLGMKAAARKRG